MKVDWDDLHPAAWDTAHAAQCGPLQQDWAYGSTMRALGVPVLRASVTLGSSSGSRETVALAQYLVRRWAGVASVALCSRGPLWLRPMSAAQKAEVHAALRRSLPIKGLRLVLQTPEAPWDDRSETGLSPWRRVMTGYSTVMLDLTQDSAALRAGFDAKWRNRLAAAEASGLVVQRVGTNPGQYRWLLDQDEAQSEQRGIAGLPKPFYELYVPSRKQPAQTLLTLRADLGRERVAAMLFLLHGQAATYQIGWSNTQGRERNAHNLLLWQAMTELRERGIRQLDLGGVNTARSAGLARFKLGTGGTVLRLAGTYF